MADTRHYAATAYRALFDDAALPGEVALRRQALDALLETGVPSRRVEGWKWTDLRTLAEAPLPLAAPVDHPTTHEDTLFAGLKVARLIIANGCYRPDLADTVPDGIDLVSAAAALTEGPDWARGLLADDTSNVFSRMNAAFLQDGVILKVKRNMAPARPLHLIIVNEGPAAAAYTRSAVVLDQGSELTLIEEHLGAGEGVVNTALSISLGRNTRLDHIRANRNTDGSVHVGNLTGTLDRDARYAGTFFTTGGLSRIDTGLRLTGENAEISIDDAYLLQDREHCDNTVVINHAVPHGTSNQTFRGVLADQARGVVQDKIIVAEGASQTDGNQRIQALLLSDRAEQDIKPELEIYNDDVTCSHGATIGQLDQQALFYLRSRGVPLAEARAMMIRAFLAETLDGLKNETVQECLLSAINGWLAAQTGRDAP